MVVRTTRTWHPIYVVDRPGRCGRPHHAHVTVDRVASASASRVRIGIARPLRGSSPVAAGQSDRFVDSVVEVVGRSVSASGLDTPGRYVDRVAGVRGPSRSTWSPRSTRAAQDASGHRGARRRRRRDCVRPGRWRGYRGPVPADGRRIGVDRGRTRPRSGPNGRSRGSGRSSSGRSAGSTCPVSAGRSTIGVLPHNGSGRRRGSVAARSPAAGPPIRPPSAARSRPSAGASCRRSDPEGQNVGSGQLPTAESGRAIERASGPVRDGDVVRRIGRGRRRSARAVRIEVEVAEPRAQSRLCAASMRLPHGSRTDAEKQPPAVGPSPGAWKWKPTSSARDA